MSHYIVNNLVTSVVPVWAQFAHGRSDSPAHNCIDLMAYRIFDGNDYPSLMCMGRASGGDTLEIDLGDGMYYDVAAIVVYNSIGQ